MKRFQTDFRRIEIENRIFWGVLFFLCMLFGAAAEGRAAVKGVYRGVDGSVVSGAYARGIDVSKNNGEIDWKAVKASGIEFAMIRCGYGSNIKEQDDIRWQENVTGCEAVKIPYGVYLYSYADTKAKAVSEAKHVLRLLKGHKPQYPIYLDMEDPVIFRSTTPKQRGIIAKAFCDRIKAAGYKASIYSGKYNFERELTDPVFDKLGRWVAHYSKKCGYQGTYQMWQATNKGRVAGIQGNVDINYMISSQIFVKPAIQIKSTKKKTAKITWKPGKAGTICYIYYAASKKGKWNQVRVSGKKGTSTLKSLKAGKTYYFRVRISRRVKSTVVYSKYSAVKKCKIRRK